MMACYVRVLVLYSIAFLLDRGWLGTKFVPVPAWINVAERGAPNTGPKYRPQKVP